MAEKLKTQDNPTTVDGVRAIEMRYRAVRETDTENIAFYQSSMRLNSPAMGVIMPERFLPVLESDDRCVPIFRLALVQVLQAAAKFVDRELSFEWISIYMPLRILRRNDCAEIVKEISDKCKTSPEKICLEISPALLEETDAAYAVSLSRLRKLGFHTMLTGVGGNGCPMLKLADFELDYIMLDEELTNMIDVNERSDACVKSVISLINELGAEPIASGVSSSDQADKLFGFECSYYTGAYAGNFLLERFVRRRSST